VPEAVVVGRLPDALVHLVVGVVEGSAGLDWSRPEFPRRSNRYCVTGIVPVVLAYEDFVQKPEAAVTWIIRRIGVPVDRLSFPSPPIERQADTLSDEWITRFLAEVRAI
jgi:hypothetical protein